MKIQWSSTAVADLESIREYIANDSPTAARKVSKEPLKIGEL
jgi:plasmid stabilization system protein ParE